MAQLSAKLTELRDRLRPGQREIADWNGGRLAVSAVPGAGKSTGMAVAAAITIAVNQLHQRKQLVVVTFTRSATANIKSKIRNHLKDLGLPAGGFTVQTLHGLAWTIARAYPEFSSIDPEAVLITPNQAHRLIRSTVERWISGNPALYQRLVEGTAFDGEETERLRRQSVLRTEILPAIAATVIHEAKSSGLSPDDLVEQSHFSHDDYQILTIAAGLYEQYQEQLQLNNWIDYDEMILSALRVLENPSIRQRWQEQCFAVFEDEAQDSSPLQTRLLEMLAITPDGEQQNLVRVGDPNQAINSTFTPADPVFFREFCASCQVDDRLAEMHLAGRSSEAIITAANFMLEWTNSLWEQARPLSHDSEIGAKNLPSSNLGALAEPPFRSQLIQIVPADDPQPNANPAPEGTGLEIHTPPDINDSIARIGQRVINLFAANPQGQAAILVRTNDQGKYITKNLRELFADQIEILEVGESDRRSQIPAEMLALLQFIDRPHSPDNLKAALSVLMQRRRIPSQDLNRLAAAPEQFLYPMSIDPQLSEAAKTASRFCKSLLKARMELPTYQLITFLAYTLDYEQTELATADKLSERILQQTRENSLGEMLALLGEIVSSEQFEPVDADGDTDKYTKAQQLTIITMHKAKGLDWDYVFIPFLHENMIPGNPYVPQQVQFLGGFTLAEVARAQIRSTVHNHPIPDLETAWERAGALKTAEEFRLLYVAMTRAKRLLWISAAKQAPFVWSKPENLQERPMCPVIPAMMRQFPQAVVSDDDAVDF
ncbi:ATP-dependent helicase [filamentous cyanobacterium LEGE 11480]|uniref:DNA 3'-5' helicase n=2 Tax=Romeriopsis TaxID=2992131 RepID=A0A928Z3S3_9CYAN|nr:ATP-dependent helicase [Romeriopsis navalis LEGE 11480]